MRNPLNWQYNGVAPMKTLVEWCEQHIPDEHVYHGWESILFLTPQAKMLFLLRWS
jgi:hypothetical protein